MAASTPALLAVLLVTGTVRLFPQTAFDPFTAYPGLYLAGRLQEMVVNDQYLVVHRVEPRNQHVLEAWSAADLRQMLWQKHFVSFPGTIVLVGDRVAFDAAESLPASRSVGRHILNAQTGSPISYRRGGIIGHAGRFLVESGDAITDMTNGAEVFGHLANVRHVRFVASVGSRVLLLVSQAGAWETRRPVLYDPGTKTDLWAGRTIAPSVQEFLDQRVKHATRPAFDGFPILLAADGQPAKEPSRFLRLRENGEGTLLDRSSFGLPESPGSLGVDFAYSRASSTGRILVAGIGDGLGADRPPVLIATFDDTGRKVAQTALSTDDSLVAWSGLTPGGNLLLFVNQLRTPHRDLIVTYALPTLIRSQVESAYNAQINGPPRLLGTDLFVWDRVRRYPEGTTVPPKAPLWMPVVVSLYFASGAVTSYYPFTEERWKLMAAAKDRIRHAANATTLYLPFQPSDGSRDVTRLLALPRSVKGWFDASLSVEPVPTYTDTDAKVIYSPASAVVSVSTGRPTGTTWRTPSMPGVATFTLSLGAVTQTFPVDVRVRPANPPPVAQFRLLDWSSVTPGSPEASFNAEKSYDPNGRIVSYAFDFGDKTPVVTGAGSFARHTYAKPGEYVVTLTVTDDKGAAGQATKTITVGAVWNMGGQVRSIPAALAGSKKVGYDISIATGDAEGAGTNANVYVSLYSQPGAEGERTGTGEIHLYDAIDEGYKDAFERGHTDVFKAHQGKAAGFADVAHLDVIDFITVRHDAFGGRPDWLIRTIRIRNQASGQEWYFEPDMWLSWDRAPLANGVALFRPTGANYPRGLLFGGSRKAWDLTEAGGNVFILKTATGAFYFTVQDRAAALEVYLNGVVVGRQGARGTGIAEAPYIPKPDWGVEYDIAKITKPTAFTVRVLKPGANWVESTVWVFPSSWATYQAEALTASVLLPLRDRTSALLYGDSVRQAMKNSASWGNILGSALAPVLSFGAQSMVLFGAPTNLDLKGTIEERVGLHVAQGLNLAAKALGLALASSVVGETIGLFKVMVQARELAGEIGNVTAAGAAAAGGLDLLGRMADCNPNLVQVTSMLRVAKGKIDTFFARLDANDPAGARQALEDLRAIAVGTHPQSADPAAYRIDYSTYGITDMTPELTADNYSLSMLCVMELNNIARWKSGGIAPCFPSNPVYPISDAVKRRDSAAAMTSYEGLWKDIMAIAGVVVDIALLMAP